MKFDKFSRWSTAVVVGLACSAGPGLAQAQSGSTFGPVYATLQDPCAVFNAPVTGTTLTQIVYGEPVNFTIDGNTVAVITTSTTGAANLKFMINAHGDGIGANSGIKYQFNGKLQAKANTTGNVLDPNFQFNGSFKVSARVIGQGNAASTGQVAQGAQDNAVFDFYVRVNYANGVAVGNFDNVTTKFTLTCQASPWSNQMTALKAGTKAAVGRGFGDVWNKYAWSTADFNGGLVVGTKNAYFDYSKIGTYSDTNNASPAAQCYRDPTNITPSIYRGLACAELFEAPAEGGSSTDTRFAEIWRLDYAKNTWSQVRNDTASQGFRIMTTHNSKLYVGSDLGSFVAGVDLKTGPAPGWNFPGSRILTSTDGINFTAVPCDSTVSGPCTSATGVSNSPPPNVNTSFRALASYGGKLYLGTFNPTGGELWSYDSAAAAANAWRLIKKFSPVDFSGFPTNKYHPAVTELTVFNGKLYVGLGGAGIDYLRVYDGTTLSPVAGLPTLTSPTNIGVLKLFASSKGLLYIGSVDFAGFNLQTMDKSGVFSTVTATGFANSSNAYAWSMAELNGRTFVGTFNTGFLSQLPRGSAELWYSDDSINWQQMALPVDFGFWNYGIRTMTFANKQLYLGTASNVVAPDLITQPVPLSPGAEVWSIKANTATR